ncbi:MAG: helix-turn-helix domain-containing protein [Arthrobacter sp.]|jgi:transcriptional regulator with XRE-family HTH domain|nr:helix-turn-helix domain-containing protein [Arthrobacter sp.]
MDASKHTSPLWREAVGEALRDQRHELGRRLIDVAGDAGVSPQYLSELERGLKDPSSEMLDAVAGALGIDAAELGFRAAARLRRAAREAELVSLAAAVRRGDALPGITLASTEAAGDPLLEHPLGSADRTGTPWGGTGEAFLLAA